MSVRSLFITALAARLATITMANGYATEVATVAVWRRYPVEPGETPCLLVNDTSLERDHNRMIGMVHNTLLVQIVAVVSGVDPDTARDMDADIIRCLGDWDSGLVDDALLTKTELMMEQYDKLVAAVRCVVTATYYTENDQC